MSSTILMAIVLVIMWLVVLVPMFVRRGDERAELRSMDRFTTAMRVLSRRGPSSGGVAGRRRYVTAPPAPYADGASPVRTAARIRMLRRRRRTLGVLTATVLVGTPAAVLVSPLLWVPAAPAVLLLGGYVGWLRQQVHREHERRSRRRAMFGEAAAPATAEHAVRRTRPVTPVIAEPVAVAPGRSWRPVPVPTPGYVTAPVVRRHAANTVDLDDDDLSFTDLDDRARAVNE